MFCRDHVIEVLIGKKHTQVQKYQHKVEKKRKNKERRKTRQSGRDWRERKMTKETVW